MKVIKMVDFHSTAVVLQSTINVADGLAKNPYADQGELLKCKWMLETCINKLYGENVKVAGKLTTQELSRLYREVLAMSHSVFARLSSIAYELNVDTVSLPISRDKLVPTLIDPASLDLLPTNREDLIVYQLELIKDVIDALIKDKTISSDSAMIGRYIYRQYGHVIQLLSEFLSFEGKVIPENINKLWNRGYVTTDRSTQRIPPCIEIIIPSLITLQVPIRGKY